MTNIEKKIRPEIFEKLENGELRFDLRLADFDVVPGDTIVYKEWDPDKKEYTGRSAEKTVSKVSSTKDFNFWTDEDILRYGFHAIRLTK